MQINEVSKLAGLTKKAVDYYVLHGLVAPAVLDNGYREYSEQDAEILTKIGTLRKLDVSIQEIKAILNEPVQSQTQQDAYDTIISFLDSVPQPDIPSDLQEYLIEGTGHIGTEQMVTMLAATKKSVENPEKFLSDNKDVIEWYLSYKQSEEYKNSPQGRLMMLMQRFNSTSGYNDIFIPAMKRLSSAYCEYHRQIEAANEKFLAQYPEIEGLNKLLK